MSSHPSDVASEVGTIRREKGVAVYDGKKWDELTAEERRKRVLEGANLGMKYREIALLLEIYDEVGKPNRNKIAGTLRRAREEERKKSATS